MGIVTGHEVTLQTGEERTGLASGGPLTFTGKWYQFTCSCGYKWYTVMTDDAPGKAPICPHARISQEDCEAIHGHCFERTDVVYASNPPQYPEVCKHCGKRRVGVPQAAMRYYDPDEPLVKR